MIQTNTNTSGLTRIINLSEVETNKAMQTASLCESVKIKIHNLTPNRGPVNIPVRIDSPMNTMAIEKLEEITKYGLATKEEFRAMGTIYRIMSEKIHIFTRSELEEMKKQNNIIL